MNKNIHEIDDSDFVEYFVDRVMNALTKASGPVIDQMMEDAARKRKALEKMEDV